MLRVLTVSLLAGATVLVGCTNERQVNTSYDENSYQLSPDTLTDYYGEGNLDLSDASTYGAMGPVSDIGGLAAASGYGEAGYLNVNVVTSNQNGAAMHILSFEGDLNQLNRGERYTFNANDYYYDEAETGEAGYVYATSTNCSGSEVGNWDYDTQAAETSVVVEDGAQPGELLVKYETVSDDGFFGPDVSGGEFVLNQPVAGETLE